MTQNFVCVPLGRGELEMARVLLPARQLASTFEDLAKEFESMFGRPVSASSIFEKNENGRFVPSLDISETAEGYEVSVDIPGVKPEDVKLEIHENQLVVSGKRVSCTEKKEKNYHRVERSFGEFQRAVLLPSAVDQDKIEATYDAGVLHVNLPKAVKNGAKKIEVKSVSK
jgi:HSP20 family protein